VAASTSTQKACKNNNPYARSEAGTAPELATLLKAFFWVRPLAAMPRFTARAATADVMSGSDCAEGFAWQFRADKKCMAIHNS
jgi:hypothetical protein